MATRLAPLRVNCDSASDRANTGLTELAPKFLRETNSCQRGRHPTGNATQLAGKKPADAGDATNQPPARGTKLRASMIDRFLDVKTFEYEHLPVNLGLPDQQQLPSGKFVHWGGRRHSRSFPISEIVAEKGSGPRRIRRRSIHSSPADPASVATAREITPR